MPTEISANENAASPTPIAADESSTSTPASVKTKTICTQDLQELMLERIGVIDSIRTLLQNELEQDNALIAEFTEKIVQLEQDAEAKSAEIEELHKSNEERQKIIEQKDNEIAKLFDAIEKLKVENSDIRRKNDDLTKRNNAFGAEFQTLAATIDDLVARNVTLEDEANKLKEEKNGLETAMTLLKDRNEELVNMATQVTQSLKDAKKSLEREFATIERLKKEKADARASLAETQKEHRAEIDAWKKRLEDAASSKAQLNKEMDELRTSLCHEQLVNTKLSGLEANLQSAERTITNLSKEKNRLADELAKVTKKNAKLEKELAASDPHLAFKKELDDLRKKLCKEQQANIQYSGLKARLDETERFLEKVTAEKNKLRVELGEVQEIKEKLSAESQSISSTEAWLEEKANLEKRLHQSERALVMLANDRDSMEKKWKEEMNKNKQLTAAAKNEPADVTKLKMTFLKEKQGLMKRQQELEGMLIEALKSGGNNYGKLADNPVTE
ncbi:hypothetical protein ACHAXS_002354 [Conticribra weissflogii]